VKLAGTAALLAGGTLLAGGLMLAGEVTLAVSGQSSVAARPKPERQLIAEGVYLYRTAPYGEVGLDGNSIVIISTDGVLVFDTNGTPSAAAMVLEDIRTLTSQPVRYVVNSHWHWDHWYGTEVYTRAFPDVKVIAHERTKAMMAGPAIEFNKPGLDTQLPGYLKQLEQRIAKAEAATPTPPELPRLKQANTTYTDELTLKLGGREIQVLHHDRAVTPGDTFVYLPKEKIVITGDLLVNPVSFALSSYPSGWIKTLEFIDALDASIIVPGHGAPLRDETLLKTTLAVFRELVKRGADAKARGLDPDAARAEIIPQIKELAMPITGDTPAGNRAFETQLVDWFLHRVYDELNGPLTDAIAPIPPK
jgi:cyclase